MNRKKKERIRFMVSEFFCFLGSAAICTSPFIARAIGKALGL